MVFSRAPSQQGRRTPICFFEVQEVDRASELALPLLVSKFPCALSLSRNLRVVLETTAVQTLRTPERLLKSRKPDPTVVHF